MSGYVQWSFLLLVGATTIWGLTEGVLLRCDCSVPAGDPGVPPPALREVAPGRQRTPTDPEVASARRSAAAFSPDLR